MKKDEVKKPKKLRLSRETLQPLTGSDAQKVVGGTGGCGCSISPATHCEVESEACDTA